MSKLIESFEKYQNKKFINHPMMFNKENIDIELSKIDEMQEEDLIIKNKDEFETLLDFYESVVEGKTKIDYNDYGKTYQSEIVSESLKIVIDKHGFMSPAYGSKRLHVFSENKRWLETYNLKKEDLQKVNSFVELEDRFISESDIKRNINELTYNEFVNNICKNELVNSLNYIRGSLTTVSNEIGDENIKKSINNLLYGEFTPLKSIHNLFCRTKDEVLVVSNFHGKKFYELELLSRFFVMSGCIQLLPSFLCDVYRLDYRYNQLKNLKFKEGF